ncbi:uncharacterized protein J3R85_004716 [Psidium guajava]|nr:uncharacterized protein J3R85_004716 [Psidium guajava]
MTMVHVDRQLAGITPAHKAGLRCLSARAAAAPSTVTSRNRLLSFSSPSDHAMAHLCNSGVEVQFACSKRTSREAKSSLSSPPLLTFTLFSPSAYPSASGSPTGASLLARLISTSTPLNLPIASVSLQVAGNAFWPKCWEPKLLDPARSLRELHLSSSTSIGSFATGQTSSISSTASCSSGALITNPKKKNPQAEVSRGKENLGQPRWWIREVNEEEA